MNSDLFATFVNNKCYEFLQKRLDTDAMVNDLNNLIHDILQETKNEMLTLSTLKINFKKERNRCNNSVIQFPHLKNAYHIDLKDDIEKYLKSNTEFLSLNEKNELPVIMYADDIVASGSGKNAISYLHLAYKFSDVDSGKLEHYKTYGISITKIEKQNNYQDILRHVMKEFNTLTFTHNNKVKKLNPIFFIADNLMIQSAFDFKKSFSNKSKSCCRACTLDGEKFHLCTKKFSLDKVLREAPENFFPRNNNMIFDTIGSGSRCQNDTQKSLCTISALFCLSCDLKNVNANLNSLKHRTPKDFNKRFSGIQNSMTKLEHAINSYTNTLDVRPEINELHTAISEFLHF
uniref:Reverse transcriptase domain-containing protein n=1 Tax=Strongyloides venezuelensis TaxID=75913 RepID=A0A0K0FB86_STRVS